VTITRVGAELVAEKERNGARPSYVEKLIQHLHDFIVPFLGQERAVDSISAADLESFKASLSSKVGPLTANRILTTLRQTMKLAERHGLYRCPRLPGNYSERISDAVARWQILDPKETAYVLAFVEAEYRPLLTFVANTGTRIGEALAIRREWCDLVAGRVIVPGVATKSRKPRVLELNTEAVQVLRLALAGGAPFVFPFEYWRVWKAWSRARTAANAGGIRIHDLRHSRISNLLDDGVPPHVVRDMVGHCSIAVTDRYAHSTDVARREAAMRVPVTVPAIEFAAGCGTKSGTVQVDRIEVPERFRVPRDGVEPPTRGFSVPCSTT
jgi:integrase